MGKKQAQIYKAMERDLIIELENEVITAPVALTKLVKLRQITSNFALSDGKPIDITPTNPKLAELQAILDQIGNKQVIIWAVHRHMVECIGAILGDRATIVYGATKDKDSAIKAFQNGDKQYLVANTGSIAHGLTLTNASYSVYVEHDYSWEKYFQSRGRIHRISQTNKCTYISILARGSIDEAVYKVLVRKGKQDEIITEIMKNVGKRPTI